MRTINMVCALPSMHGSPGRLAGRENLCTYYGKHGVRAKQKHSWLGFCFYYYYCHVLILASLKQVAFIEKPSCGRINFLTGDYISIWI